MLYMRSEDIRNNMHYTADGYAAFSNISGLIFFSLRFDRQPFGRAEEKHRFRNVTLFRLELCNVTCVYVSTRTFAVAACYYRRY